MKEVVNKIDAIEAVYKIMPIEYRVFATETKQLCDRKELVSALEALPLADVVQGEWIMHIDDLFPQESTQECSNCHEHETIFIRNSNYCPNCGARMKGGVE